MEKVRKVVKKYYLRQIITYWLVCWMFFGLPAQVAMASMNAGNIVTTGTLPPGVSFDDTVANITTVIAPHQSIIEYEHFNVDALKTLHFDQALATDAVLNRIVYANPSNINGSITALGRVFIVNPAGIIFGGGSTVNVAQLVASGLGMSNQAFLDATNVGQNNKMVFDDLTGGSGNVTINGTLNATDTGSLYFVGQNVYNNGSIVCPDGLVVMAAGDTVKLGQPGSAVIVDLADFTFGTTNQINSDVSSGSITAKNVILAAGDMWSGAMNVETLRAEAKGDVVVDGLINANAVAASDAVATVEIIAGDDVTVNSNISADTYSNTGVATDDAISTIDIHADGSVNVNSQVKANSESRNSSGNANATVTVDADENVNINGHVEAYAKAKYSSGDALATVNLTADGVLDVDNSVLAYARTQYDAGNSTALVDILAGDVDIYDNVEAHATVKDNSGNAMADVVIDTDYAGIYGLVKSWTRTSYDSGNATSKTTIIASDDVYIEDGSVESWAVTEDYTGINEGTGPNLDATVDIDAVEEVELGDEDEGFILAVAKTGTSAYGNIGTITSLVDIDAGKVVLYDGTVAAVAKTGQDSQVNAGDIKATVDIKTIGYSGEGSVDGDVIVSSGSYYDNELQVDLSAIEAHAEAGSGITGTAGNITATVNIDASGMLDVDKSGIEADATVGYVNFAQAGNLTAMVDILTGGDVMVNDSLILALAHKGKTSADIGDSKATVIVDAGGNVDVQSPSEWTKIHALAADGTINDAAVDIDADGYVKVQANGSAYDDNAWIHAEARNGDDNNSDITITAGGYVEVSASGNGPDAHIWSRAWDGGDNTANLTIDAGGDLTAIASNGADVEIESQADGGSTNSATTTILTDGGVLVQSDWNNNSNARIRAEAESAEVSNTAKIKVTALEDVVVTSDDSTAEIFAQAQFSKTDDTDNQADINITARSVEVKTKHDAAEITAYSAEGATNKSSVMITATGEEILDGDVVVGIDGGNVKVKSDPGEGDPGFARIMAIAFNDSEEVSNDNTANVTIDAAGDVEIIARDGGEAEIIAEASNWLYIEDGPYSQLVNTAGVDIDADGRVLVKAEDDWYDYEYQEWVPSYAGISANALNFFDGDEAEGPVDISLNGLTNEASVDIDAAKVEVLSYDGAESEILAEAANTLEWDYEDDGYPPFSLVLTGDNINNTANVNVTTVAVEDDQYYNGNVKVKSDGGDYAGISAEALNDVLDIAEIESADEIPSNLINLATTKINADGEIKIAGYEGEAAVTAYTAFAANNTSNVGITANDDLKVEGYNGDAIVLAVAEDGVDNTAAVTVDVIGGDVIVEDNGYGGDYSADIVAHAEGAFNSNTADVTVNATATKTEYEDDGEVYTEVNGGNVDVRAENGGYAQIAAVAVDAEMYGGEPQVVQFNDDPYPEPEPVELDPTSNAANVTINATGAEVTECVLVKEAVYDSIDDKLVLIEPAVYEDVTYTEGGNVMVTAIDDSHAGIAAHTSHATDNTSGVEINADGAVVVMDMGGAGDTAEIIALAENAYNSNTADVLINAGNVLAVAVDGNTRIKARAAHIMPPPYYPSGPTTLTAGPVITEPDGTENNANVRINTYASDGYDPDGLLPHLLSYIPDEIVDENPNIESFLQGMIAGGHVVVGGVNGGSAQIEAVTYAGYGTGTANTSDVLICAEGGVLLGALSCGGYDTDAQIKALAHFGYSNTADVGIRAPLGLGVLAVGPYANASIASKAMFGQINQADLVACTSGPALVLGIYNDEGGAEIISEATEGYTNNAYTGVLAEEDIIVGAYEGEAMISSEAHGYRPYRNGTVGITNDDGPVYPEEPVDPTTANATTVVVSKRGIVGVVDYDNNGPASAGITSEAHGAELNNAYTGVLAAADGPSETLLGSLLDQFDEEIASYLHFDLAGFVTPGSVYVAALGSAGHSMILSDAYDGVENSAETVVAAPGEVFVYTESGNGKAYITSLARTPYVENSATVRVYASEVTAVSMGHIEAAIADGEVKYVLDYSLTGDGEVVDEGDTTLIIQDYDERTDLPVAPPCPDCYDDDKPQPIPPLPPAPLGVAPIPTLQKRVFGQGGCPALMGWLANEVGVAVDVEVFLAGAFVSSTDCQPCETAARLKRAATVLADEDGSRMAAMNQVFNPNVPFTPEMATDIATNTGAQYAMVREYIDAFVQYIAILNNEMGSPVADSVAYVMEKYGSGVSGNDDMAGFLAARIESGETYTPAQ